MNKYSGKSINIYLEKLVENMILFVYRLNKWHIPLNSSLKNFGNF